MSDLLTLMKQLGSDAGLAQEYEKNPTAVIDRYKLTAEERKALLAADIDALLKLTGLKSALYATNTTVSVYDNKN